MTPYERAARWHLRNCPGTPWAEVVEAHFQGGYVFSGPERFVIGRRVSIAWEEDRLLDPWQVDPEGDAWHLWLCAGDLRAIAATVPYPLPWCVLHRRGVLRKFRLDVGYSGFAAVGEALR